MTTTTDPSTIPAIDAHVPPPRGAGLRKNAVYLALLVGAAVVLGGLAIASQRTQRTQPFVETPLVFGKPEMVQTTTVAKLQAGYAGFDPSAIAAGYGAETRTQTTTKPSDDDELARLRAQLMQAELSREQDARTRALAEYEAAMGSPLLFKTSPLVRAAAAAQSPIDRQPDSPAPPVAVVDASFGTRAIRANAQDEKARFLTEAAAVEPYLRKPLVPPVSDYELKAGGFIPAALVTAINSDLPGEVIAQVTQNVYDTRTGGHLLVPQGTRVLGKYQSLVSNGQNRALVVWTRLVMPNGKSIVLDGMNGIDQTGAAGAEDQVDYHFDKLAAAATLSTALAYGGNLARDGGRNRNDLDVVGETIAQESSKIGGRIIDRQLDVQPTIKIRQGFPLNVLVNKDMVLEPYADDAR